MRRDETDKLAAKAAYRELSFPQKLGHIWLYHKWTILLSLTALLVLGSVIWRVTHRKDPVLYLAMINVSLGEELDAAVGPGFLDYAGFDREKQELLIYRDLYLAEETDVTTHRSAYATRIKLMASVEQKQMDLILMSRESYDVLSSQGYLLPVEELLSDAPELSEALTPLITENNVTIEDNSIEYQLREAEELVIVTESVGNALRLDTLPLFSGQFQEPLYLGVVANTPRRALCLDYLRYLLRAEPES